jgi:hypothetical protein
MSDTPRTDVSVQDACAIGGDGWAVEADFARQLERELTAARTWKDAVIEKLAVTWAITSENENCPQKAVNDLVASEVAIALNPAVSSEAEALIERGRQELRAEVEALRAALQMIEHATAPTHDDDGYHENAYSLARAALAKEKAS